MIEKKVYVNTNVEISFSMIFLFFFISLVYDSYNSYNLFYQLMCIYTVIFISQ